jgi:hypothetical protein
MAMIEISQIEFDQHPVLNMRLPTVTEKRWFKHEGLLGIVLLDNVDNDWAWVALAEADDGKWRAFDVGHSLTSADVAAQALDAALQEGRRPPHPTKTELLVEKAVRNSGMTHQLFDQELSRIAHEWASRRKPL